MRTAPRYFIIADDGTIRRIAQAKFHNIILERAPAPAPEFHGKRVRFAQVYVKFDGRKPVGVQRASFGYLTFGVDGYFDPSEWEAAAALTIENWTIPSFDKPASLLDGRARFAQQRSRHEYEWQPTDELRKKLFATATGKA